MQTKLMAFGHFPVTVECRCAGPEHGADCDREENEQRAAAEALKGGVEVVYDEFIEREGE